MEEASKAPGIDLIPRVEPPPPATKRSRFHFKGRCFLSSHALLRAESRVKIPVSELLKVYEFGVTALFANDALGPHKEHHLFYDPIANECFIMVVDPFAREIVTILPLHYRQNKSAPFPQSKLTEARHTMAEAVQQGIVDLPAPGDTPTHVPSDRTYRVKVWHRDPEGTLKVHDLTGWKHADHPYPLSTFARKPDVLREILRILTALHVNLNSIELLVAKNGKGAGAEKENIPLFRILQHYRR